MFTVIGSDTTGYVPFAVYLTFEAAAESLPPAANTHTDNTRAMTIVVSFFITFPP